MCDVRTESLCGRRCFLNAVVPGGILACFAGQRLLGASQAVTKPQGAGPKHKFFEDSAMSFAEVYKSRYGQLVPLMRSFEQELGRERFDAMLKGITDRLARQEGAADAKRMGRNDFYTFNEDLRKPNYFWQHALTYAVIEDSARAFEVKVAECLWAQTFREVMATDLGYLLICDPDYGYTEGYNPKMRMIRSKTLMQGHDCCNHRWIIEG